MPDDDKNKSSDELLLKAAREGNLEVVKFLIANGANIEAKDERGRQQLDRPHVGDQKRKLGNR